MSNEVTTVSEVVSDEVTNHPIGGGGLPNNKIYWPDLPSKPLPPIQIYYPAVTYFTSALFISGGVCYFCFLSINILIIGKSCNLLSYFCYNYDFWKLL